MTSITITVEYQMAGFNGYFFRMVSGSSPTGSMRKGDNLVYVTVHEGEHLSVYLLLLL